MKCWKCEAKIPDEAQTCPACQADLMEALLEEGETQAMIEDWLEGRLDHNALPESLKRGVEELLNDTMVGPCVHCQSKNVSHCLDDPVYGDLSIGRCFDCGTVWCAYCSYILGADETECPQAEEHEAEIEDTEDEEDEEEEPEDDDDDLDMSEQNRLN